AWTAGSATCRRHIPRRNSTSRATAARRTTRCRARRSTAGSAALPARSSQESSQLHGNKTVFPPPSGERPGLRKETGPYFFRSCRREAHQRRRVGGRGRLVHEVHEALPPGRLAKLARPLLELSIGIALEPQPDVAPGRSFHQRRRGVVLALGEAE